MSEIKTITYKGRSVLTKNCAPMSAEELKAVRDEYFKKPDITEVYRQMRVVSQGGVTIDKLTRYYFKRLMAKTICENARWSVEEVFESPEVCGIFKAKVLNSPQVFPKNDGMAKNIAAAIRLGGKGYARIPTQFPIKAVDTVLEKYSVNNNYYDFSCGWGGRLIGALKHNINYYGTDPNYELVTELYRLNDDWKHAVGGDTLVDIRSHGSEIYVPEWEGKMGLAFSSPPYFSLEDYRIGNQSYKPGMTIEEWLRGYLKPTIRNVKRYLTPQGVLAFNIKNTKYPLIEYSQRIIEESGFISETVVGLTNIKRTKSSGGFTDSTDEQIFIYRKD